ncbi:MAG TPA: VWA domain-containing protein [Acidimicrobiales bacterium]
MTREADAATGGDRIAVAFAAVLRGHGVDVPVGSVLAFARALGEVGASERTAVYWAGRATLLRRPEDAVAYDAAFGTFWLQRDVIHTLRSVPEPVTVAVDDGTDDVAPAPDDDAPADPQRRILHVRYSAVETLRHKDFATYTHAEFDEARRLMAGLRLGGARRKSRRLHAAKGNRRTSHPDLRRTVHDSLRLHGEPIRRRYREPSDRPRRLVLLCDVSGSMDAYSRALLRFLHAAIVGRGRVEAFAIGTRTTRVTRELSSHDPDAALAAAARAVDDWSGGTRLGAGLRAFNDRYGVRGMARGAVVVVLSDGWDRGEPDELATQMGRLARVAHRIVWVNPLKSTPGYAPLARGMAAALPYVDEFVEGHSLASLERLAEVVNRP